jgi:hypothetical protein
MGDKMDATRRKRTILAVACVAGAMVVGAMVVIVASVTAWHWSSRGNSVENRLLGEWWFARNDGARVFLVLQPEQTFRSWTSAGVDDVAGTWNLSGDELILSLPETPPDRQWALLASQGGAWFENPAWVEDMVSLTLENVTSSTFRVHDKRDGAEIVYRRVDSTVRSGKPR